MKNYTVQAKYFSDPSFTPVLVTFWNHIGQFSNRHYEKYLSGMEIKSKVDLISELKIS